MPSTATRNPAGRVCRTQSVRSARNGRRPDARERQRLLDLQRILVAVVEDEHAAGAQAEHPAATRPRRTGARRTPRVPAGQIDISARREEQLPAVGAHHLVRDVQPHPHAVAFPRREGLHQHVRRIDEPRSAVRDDDAGRSQAGRRADIEAFVGRSFRVQPVDRVVEQVGQRARDQAAPAARPEAVPFAEAVRGHDAVAGEPVVDRAERGGDQIGRLLHRPVGAAGDEPHRLDHLGEVAPQLGQPLPIGMAVEGGVGLLHAFLDLVDDRRHGQAGPGARQERLPEPLVLPLGAVDERSQVAEHAAQAHPLAQAAVGPRHGPGRIARLAGDGAHRVLVAVPARTRHAGWPTARRCGTRRRTGIRRSPRGWSSRRGRGSRRSPGGRSRRRAGRRCAGAPRVESGPVVLPAPRSRRRGCRRGTPVPRRWRRGTPSGRGSPPAGRRGPPCPDRRCGGRSRTRRRRCPRRRRGRPPRSSADCSGNDSGRPPPRAGPGVRGPAPPRAA